MAKLSHEQSKLTAAQVQERFPKLYKEVFADDLANYPNGRELSLKVKNGEMSIEQACYEILTAPPEEDAIINAFRKR